MNMIRLFVAGLFACLLGVASGCMMQDLAPGNKMFSRPVQCGPVEVIVNSDIARLTSARLGIVLFETAPEDGNAGRDVAGAYREALLKYNVFREIVLIPQTAGGDEQAIWWGRQEVCDLVMRSSIGYLMDGSGALPTRLQIGVRVLDTRSGRIVWELRQQAESEPGKDIDLVWTTIPGEPARRVPLLVRALADQFANFLIEPLKKK